MPSAMKLYMYRSPEKQDDVHWTDEGLRTLAKYVSNSIWKEVAKGHRNTH